MKYYIATVEYWVDGVDKTVAYRHIVCGNGYADAMNEMMNVCYDDSDVKTIQLQEISCEEGPLMINRRIAEDILAWQENIAREDGEPS